MRKDVRKDAGEVPWRRRILLTFTDDKSRYTWVYMKSKDQVFERFPEWKALVERQSKQKLKAFRTDNGGEYTSNAFEKYLRDEGIRHEKTIPKTPQWCS